MTTGSVSLHHFSLGLLIRKPASGDDINRLLKSLGWLIGSPSLARPAGGWPGDPGQRLALDYGLALAATESIWLDGALNRLSQPHPMEVLQDV